MNASSADYDDTATKPASESQSPAQTFVPVSPDAVRYVASAIAIVFLFVLLPLIPEGPTATIRFGFLGLFAGMHVYSLVQMMRRGHGRKRCVLTVVVTALVIAGGNAVGVVNPLVIVPGSTTKEVADAIGVPLGVEKWSEGGNYTGGHLSSYWSGNPNNPGSVRLSVPSPGYLPETVKGQIHRYRSADLYFDTNGILLRWNYAINRR